MDKKKCPNKIGKVGRKKKGIGIKKICAFCYIEKYKLDFILEKKGIIKILLYNYLNNLYESLNLQEK